MLALAQTLPEWYWRLIPRAKRGRSVKATFPLMLTCRISYPSFPLPRHPTTLWLSSYGVILLARWLQVLCCKYVSLNDWIMLARIAVHAALQRIDRWTSTINNLASREAPRNCRAPMPASRRYTSCCLSVDMQSSSSVGWCCWYVMINVTAGYQAVYTASLPDTQLNRFVTASDNKSDLTAV